MTPQTLVLAYPRGPRSGSVLAEAPLGGTQHGAGGGDDHTRAAAARSRLVDELAAWRVLKIAWPHTVAAIIEWIELGDRAAAGEITRAVAHDWRTRQLVRIVTGGSR